MAEYLKWTHIIIHHSETKDDIGNDWIGIKKYHTSWRYEYNIITEEKAKELIAQGKEVEKPWSDIAYNFGIEKDNNKYVYRLGRPLTVTGGHAKGMNDVAIGICLVGNYDIVAPAEKQYIMLAQLCKVLCDCFNIPIDNIKKHSEYAYKTCPGTKFNMASLKNLIQVV